MLRLLFERILVKPFSWGIIVTFLEIRAEYKKSNISPAGNIQYQKLMDKIYDYIEKSRFKLLDNFINNN